MNNIETDILSIDSSIKTKILSKKDKLQEYKIRLSEIQGIVNIGNVSFRHKTILEKNILELIEEIRRIEANEELNFYISETVEILEKYNNILKTPLKVSFTGKPVSNNKEKEEIINKYLQIAQKYYKIDNKTNEKKFKIKCDNCDNKKDFSIEENVYICEICGCQHEIIHNVTSYKDSDRVNTSSKYTYDKKVHFRDCINQYQGKQNCSIDPHVYEELESAFEKHQLLRGSKDVKKEIRFKDITKEHILMFLKELGYSKHYENVNLLHYNLTGKKPDDISHLEDKLLYDFDVLVETYDKHFKNKLDRVNFISTQYVLFQLLQKHKHFCKKEDFVILKTMDRKSFHDEICKELFSMLNWSFIPLY
jgi:hypothetical protein